ncbi:MAG TPA: DEAD/DEAH box helicase, partial [Crocinitomicaceae bacterium]|nr:DEAD/DEAH box helicase [Crocinitomicaceae bacterium]
SLQYVLNYDLPNEPETYVHRIGRTGRAGASGLSISLCDIDERPFLKEIEKLVNKKIKVISDHPFPITDRAIEEYKELQKSYEKTNQNRRSANKKRRENNGGKRRR